MAAYFEYVFWGLLLVTVDVRIQRFDILPDFLGYLLVLAGCRGLVAASPDFGTAAIFSGLLIPVSLLDFVTPSPAAIALTFVGLLLNCGVIWFLLGGIMSLGASYQRPDLATKADERRRAYIIGAGVAMLGILVGQASPGTGSLLVILAAVVMLVLVVLVLHLIWQMKQLVREGKS